MNTIEYPSTHIASERVKDIQHVGSPWSHGQFNMVPRDNPGVYTRTFNELFKVAKERSAWKIELKGVLPSRSVDVTSVITSDYIPPVTFIDTDWIEAALAPKACVEIYNEVTNGCLGAVQICDSRNLGNHG